ncbi:MAG: alpha/beta hydrolase [Treponemataceae bacterium]|nr:alpha/beta hydrolase [Treponemataceae bacterium]
MAAVISALIGIVALACALVLAVLPPGGGTVPRVCSAGGSLLAGSLAEKCWIEADGARLGMVLLANNAESPVLLVCGGGPGIPEYLLEYLYPSALSDEFIVCYFDWRGTGLSYDSKISREAQTAGRFVADVLAVAQYLQKRFSQERIFISGHSFGSYIALKAVQSHPEHFCAYLAQSQICSQRESERRAYDWMKEQYVQAEDARTAERFSKYAPRGSDAQFETWFFSPLRDAAMHGLGVGTARGMRSPIAGIFFPSLKCRAYTVRERLNIWKGKAAARQFPAVTEMLRFDAFSEVPRVDVPVYFFVGRHDFTCCSTLQEAYYERLDAPEKRLFLFGESAHSPIYEEPERARTYIRELLHAVRLRS